MLSFLMNHIFVLMAILGMSGLPRDHMRSLNAAAQLNVHPNLLFGSTYLPTVKNSLTMSKESIDKLPPSPLEEGDAHNHKTQYDTVGDPSDKLNDALKQIGFGRYQWVSIIWRCR